MDEQLRDALADVLADALLADLEAELEAEQVVAVATAESPRGISSHAEQLVPASAPTPMQPSARSTLAKGVNVVTTSLGTWQIAGNDCTATLVMDRPRSINIALEWDREPGPAETEHFNLALPDIMESAFQVVQRAAAISEALVDLIADGQICRIGIKNGVFVYGATDSQQLPTIPPRSPPEQPRSRHLFEHSSSRPKRSDARIRSRIATG